uniref:Uncharacterized protein n=1 Tax=Staphylococcus aureus TaxID=1280 RepID=A1KWW7_STAAU|nr:unnamed protein product [Staphylococcus aureus]
MAIKDKKLQNMLSKKDIKIFIFSILDWRKEIITE